METRKITNQIVRDEWYRYFDELDPKEFTLFFMTTTYQPYQDKTYTAKDINRFYINFYLKGLLPDLFSSRKWTKARKAAQPIVLTFVESHRPRLNDERGSEMRTQRLTPVIPLHHHSIIASRPFTTDKFREMCGINTMCPYSPVMMSSDLKECDLGAFNYSTKEFWKYGEDYLAFGFKN